MVNHRNIYGLKQRSNLLQEEKTTILKSLYMRPLPFQYAIFFFNFRLESAKKYCLNINLDYREWIKRKGAKTTSKIIYQQ
jgi:hypothetical protein